jgi:DNA topoisomerase I
MLVIVESPAKAKTISRILGAKHTVKASVGHIRKITNDKKTADGRKLEINGIDIDNDFTPLFEVDPDKKKVVTELKKLAKEAKDGILFATDSDREGEAISWHLAQILKVPDDKVKRLEFHEITKKAILTAMENPRDLNVMLVSAQKARQVLDKLVGYKLSPVLWTAIGNRTLSAGRVQSPALHIICLREDEIDAFKAEEYWELAGLFQQDKVGARVVINEADDVQKTDDYLKLTAVAGQPVPKVVDNQKQAQDLIAGIAENNQFAVADLKIRTEYTHPKAPFITSTFQQAASSQLGIAPRQAMSMAQKLYEGIDIAGTPTALITYMRTDSVTLSGEAIAGARAAIEKVYPAALPEAPRYYKSKSKNAQEAHEAIRPTDMALTPAKLLGKIEQRMWKVYELIWKRTVASQAKDEEKQRVSFSMTNDRQDSFSGSIAWTTFPGYKQILGVECIMAPREQVTEGQTWYLETLLAQQHFTKPPSRYSAASLIKKLEELGIGRPSTYASIISTLLDRSYAEQNGSSLQPSTLGRRVDLLLRDHFQNVISSDLTADMESNLDKISRGEEEYVEMLSKFWTGFKPHVDQITGELAEGGAEKYRKTDTDVVCPTCESEMSLRMGRFGEYFQCAAVVEHRFPKNFREYNTTLTQAQEEFAEQTKGQKCTECQENLIVRVSKSSLKPYIACPEYRVGNKHTVMAVNFGPCPKCIEEGRVGEEQGKLITRRGIRKTTFIGCSLDKKICGYIQKNEPLIQD